MRHSSPKSSPIRLSDVLAEGFKCPNVLLDQTFCLLCGPNLYADVDLLTKNTQSASSFKTKWSRIFLFCFSEWAVTVRPYAAALAQVMMTASVLMLVSLTWERHFAICYPHQYRIRIRTIPLWRHLAQYIVPVVVLSFVLNIPTFINTYKVCKSNQPWYLRNSNKNSSSLAVGSVKDNSTGEHNVGKAALS